MPNLTDHEREMIRIDHQERALRPLWAVVMLFAALVITQTLVDQYRVDQANAAQPAKTKLVRS